METARPSRSEIRALLQALLQQLEARPVVTWMSEGPSDSAEVGEIVGLMLQAGTILMDEVDVFLETTQLLDEVSESPGTVPADPAADMFDLPDEESSTRSPSRG